MSRYYGKIVGGLVEVFKHDNFQSDYASGNSQEAAYDQEVTDRSVILAALDVFLSHPARGNQGLVYGEVNIEGNKIIEAAVEKAGGIDASTQRAKWEDAVRQTRSRIE